jgi:single-strand DNA-binding protein
MAGVNKVILIGHLGKDPEVRSIEGGKKVANFTLATSESYKDKSGQRVEKTEWHNIAFWGAIADVIEKYLKKGSQIYVEGRISTRSYEDKEGVKKYFTEIVGQNMTMLGGAPKSGDSSTGGYEKNGKTAEVATTFTAEEDDLPF